MVYRPNEQNRIVDRVGNGNRLCMLEDMNRWIGDRVRGGIIGAFGVTGEKRKWEKSSGVMC